MNALTTGLSYDDYFVRSASFILKERYIEVRVDIVDSWKQYGYYGM